VGLEREIPTVLGMEAVLFLAVDVDFFDSIDSKPSSVYDIRKKKN
jgi:hypothetical protein